MSAVEKKQGSGDFVMEKTLVILKGIIREDLPNMGDF
jgi:hypothetical protein